MFQDIAPPSLDRGTLSRLARPPSSLFRSRKGRLVSMAETTYEGQCFCGAVAIEVSGEALGAGYCHCANCRRWSAGPVNAFTLWKPESVKVTRGEDQLREF